MSAAPAVHAPTHDYHFASDNTSGICPEAWAALEAANRGRLPSYGTDDWTKRACDLIRALFEKPDAEVFFVFNGTAANSLSLASLCQSYHSVICHESAHVEVDECGAPEFFSNGTKLLTSSGANGKLVPAEVERLILKRTDIHFPKARVLSLTQSTEWGTVYSREELLALTAVAKRHGLAIHMDGSRFSNAAAAFSAPSSLSQVALSPADLTWRAGIDVLCFGGTKNGMNTTEAVVFFNPTLAREFDYRCKQAGQLASKMRFLSAQWVGMLEGGAWLHHARHANTMTRRLAEMVRNLPQVRLLLEPQVNALFLEMPPEIAKDLHDCGWHFYNFIGAHGYRFMCSWDTRESDLTRFVADLRASLSARHLL
ncbi:MAG TPA: low specificity L-threonine aldolase [Opitutaceae bacterium]|nr:low specificity L-threonine aldolase [Opitutaceae bacterium]